MTAAITATKSSLASWVFSRF